MQSLNINGRAVAVQAEPDMPLLWVLRCELGMTGTKFGCGVGHLRGVHGAPERQAVPVVSDTMSTLNTPEDNDH